MEDKLVILAEHPYEKALLIKSRLENEGIESILSNVNLIQPDASAGVRIKVREKDFEKALKIYENFLRDEGYETKKDTEAKKEKNVSGVKKIMVPVDFSDYSRHAAHFAMHYAHKVHAEILLLHAYFSPDLQTIPYDESFGIEGTMTEYIGDLRDAAKEEIEKLQRDLKKIAGKENLKNLTMDYSIVQGALDDAVFFASESYHPDLIIMGARGKGNRKKDPIGSSTARILEKAPVPVLVIPEDTDIQSFFDRKKIVYATDYDESDFQEIAKLVSLVRPFNMEIICTHIEGEEEEPLENIKMEGLKKYFKKSYPDLTLSCHMIPHEDVIAGLDAFVLEHPVSAIALTTHKRNLITRLFYPSITRKMFFYTTVPLLVFHA